MENVLISCVKIHIFIMKLSGTSTLTANLLGLIRRTIDSPPFNLVPSVTGIS